RQNSVAATKALLDAVDPATAADATLKVPFDWLTHLDRSPISPIDLMFVADCKPSMLTQHFVTAAGGVHGHLAPWTDETSRLHRFLEFVQGAHPRSPGVVSGGRTPGKININMIWNG